MNNIDVTAIVLTKDEELHIDRCLNNISPIVKKVFVIDCFSTDKTKEIAESYPNVVVLQHEWPATKYAGQFNWALDNAPIDTEWVLRMDADEYFTPELIKEVKEKLPLLRDNITGVVMNRRYLFIGHWMKRGIYPVKLLRFFRYGKGRCEQRLMDEHIQLTDGDIIEFNNDFVDENLHNISWWSHKHVDYAVREAVDLLDIELDLTGFAANDETRNLNDQAIKKRKMKHDYAVKPLFFRSFAYFIYRYLFKGAVLEGKMGFVGTFLQAWWYRTLVDTIILEIKRACGSDKELIKDYLKREYNIHI